VNFMIWVIIFVHVVIRFGMTVVYPHVVMLQNTNTTSMDPSLVLYFAGFINTVLVYTDILNKDLCSRLQITLG
jgi:hypothetical protein